MLKFTILRLGVPTTKLALAQPRLCWLIIAIGLLPVTARAAEFVALYEVVGREGKYKAEAWDALASSQLSPKFGIPKASDWTDHSDCGTCPNGNSRHQKFEMTNLKADEHRLSDRFAYVSSEVGSKAELVEGQKTARRADSYRVWDIVLTPREPRAGTSIGRDKGESRNYAYTNFVELSRANAVAPSRSSLEAQGARVAPPMATKVVGVDGANDFSLAYTIQALDYSLIATGDPRFAEQIVDRGDAMLAERDATTESGRTFGWLDRSSGVNRPYVWGYLRGTILRR
jgi:hypothetical protein